MAIENRELEVGIKLVAKYKQATYSAEVIAGVNGKVAFRLADGREFKSPSAAGTAITGTACNGWAFWSTAGAMADQSDPPPASEDPDVTVAAVDEQPQEEAVALEQEEEPTEDEPVAVFKRVANQMGLGLGEERLYCDACHASFLVPTGEQPTACPEGHTPELSSAWR